MKKSIFFLPILIIVIVIFSSCGDNNNLGKLRKAELEKLDAYIQSNYPNVDQKPSGLYYVEVQPGVGDSIKIGDKIQIFYATWTIDSTLIDESTGYLLGQRYDPFEFVVGNGDAIQGLEEAATYMKTGTKANLVIPSELAYGQNGTYGVSGFTTLLMQVEVYKVYPVNTGE